VRTSVLQSAFLTETSTPYFGAPGILGAAI